MLNRKFANPCSRGWQSNNIEGNWVPAWLHGAETPTYAGSPFTSRVINERKVNVSLVLDTDYGFSL